MSVTVRPSATPGTRPARRRAALLPATLALLLLAALSPAPARAGYFTLDSGASSAVTLGDDGTLSIEAPADAILGQFTPFHDGDSLAITNGAIHLHLGPATGQDANGDIHYGPGGGFTITGSVGGGPDGVLLSVLSLASPTLFAGSGASDWNLGIPGGPVAVAGELSAGIADHYGVDRGFLGYLSLSFDAVPGSGAGTMAVGGFGLAVTAGEVIVPEPASVVLLGLGVVVAGVAARQRRRAS